MSDELMCCCAAGTNEGLDFRYRAFALDGRVSAKWRRCPGSMARRARDSVASDFGEEGREEVPLAMFLAGQFAEDQHVSPALVSVQPAQI